MIPVICLLAVLLRRFLQNAPPILSNCWVHDLLFLYCPLCGGTRALGAMLRFDFFEAFRYNAAVVIFSALFLIGDLVLLIRLLRKKRIGGRFRGGVGSVRRYFFLDIRFCAIF
ncbi:MAG: DUF2752 domain-containing protein [Clostridia bacterium]|nr:DUF2752 domain-containing protein [Clostridia bacterium]